MKTSRWCRGLLIECLVMRILVIGSGGREHALAWKIKQSPHTTKIFCAPGNAGMASVADCIPMNVDDPGALADLAALVRADLTVVGPEGPLVGGISEVFALRGLLLVGPSSVAAQLEGSKIFAKRFMSRHDIPTARFVECDSPDSARAALKRDFSFPLVVKADGLAAGKGVRIVDDARAFESAIQAMMVERIFGNAGSRVVIEECLVGREASVMVFTDGRGYRVVAPAQDYKRVDEGDRGPNTGGMGSFSTPDLIDDVLLSRITREIIEPTLTGMAAEDSPFAGVLYAGLMLTTEGPRVIEFNARFGDPETQAIVMRLDSDLVEVFEAIATHQVGAARVDWSSDSSVCVVVASAGYPNRFEKGKAISGLERAASLEGVVVFHAGTALDPTGSVVTSGGRVLGVTARGSTLGEARRRAYDATHVINFEGMHYRRDIAIR
jgi:phosphoribosylamine---glycine ligase